MLPSIKTGEKHFHSRILYKNIITEGTYKQVGALCTSVVSITLIFESIQNNWRCSITFWIPLGKCHLNEIFELYASFLIDAKDETSLLMYQKMYIFIENGINTISWSL